MKIIKSFAENTVETELDKTVKDIILDHIAPMTQLDYSSNKERDWSRLDKRIDDQINDFITLHKDEIIDSAANKLVDSLKRTKAWKEKYGEIM